MRLFLGIEVPEDIKQSIEHYLAPLKTSEKGWENPHDFHLTLLFIGEVPSETIPNIKMRMESISFKPFYLTLGPLAFFNRRILYVSFQPSVQMMELKNLIDKTFPEWNKPHKEFLPHITVKRWQRYEFENLNEGIKSRKFMPKTVVVNDLVLFKSERDSENHKYHVIHRVPFRLTKLYYEG